MNQTSNPKRALSDQARLVLLLGFALAAGAATALRWHDGRWPFNIALTEPRSWTLSFRQSSGHSIFARNDAGQAVPLNRPAGPGQQPGNPAPGTPKEISDRLGDGADSSSVAQRKEIFDRLLPEP